MIYKRVTAVYILSTMLLILQMILQNLADATTLPYYLPLIKN
jgi:hypothetical protein